MPHVIAIGDGALGEKNPLLDLYVIAQSNKPKPKVCLLPTASGDNPGLIRHFLELYSNFPCEPSYLSLFAPEVVDMEDFLLTKDIIFVSGGHSRNMLTIWKDWGIDTILRKAYDQNILLAGGSAGAVCWFKECITDSYPPSLSVMPCLNFLPYSFCPHFLSKERRVAYREMLTTDRISDGYAASDLSAIHFVDGQVLRAVSAHPVIKAYKVSKDRGLEKLETFPLTEQEYQERLIWNTPTFENLPIEEPDATNTITPENANASPE
jgi:dipeptidase E